MPAAGASPSATPHLRRRRARSKLAAHGSPPRPPPCCCPAAGPRAGRRAASAREEDPKPLDPQSSIKPPRRGRGATSTRCSGSTTPASSWPSSAATARPSRRSRLYDLDGEAAEADRLVRSAEQEPDSSRASRSCRPARGWSSSGASRPDDGAPLHAPSWSTRPARSGRQGRPRDRLRAAAPATARARAALLVAFDRKLGGRGAEATYTVTPYTLATLAPAGKPRAYKTDVAGELKAPPVRLIGFYDGYTRILAERPGAYDKATDVRQPPKKVVVDALTGKTAGESRDRRPGRLGDHRPAAARPPRPIPVRRPQSRRVGCRCDRCDGEEDPGRAGGPVPSLRSRSRSSSRRGRRRTALTFGIARRPAEPRRHQAQEGGAADARPLRRRHGRRRGQGAGAGLHAASGDLSRTRPSTLVVLKRFKSFARGGDEFQIFELR